MKNTYGILVWFLVTLFVIYSFALNTAAATFTPAIKNSLNVSDLGASIASSAFIIGFACMQIPAGFLLDKFNARFVVSTGIFLLALGNVLTSFSTNIIMFTLANLIQGIGASFSFISAAVLISRWFSAKSFPILFGLTQALSCILTGIIHYYFTIALQVYSWNTLYHGLSLYGFVLLILTLLFVKSPKEYQAEKNISLQRSLKEVISNKQIILCSIAAATSFGPLLAYASLWYLQIQTYYKVENLQSIIISGIIFFGLGIGTPVLGWLSNIVKSRTMIIHLSLVSGTMALLLGIYLPHFNIDTLIIIKIISFFIGFFLSGSMLFYTMVNEIASKSTRGVAVSTLNTAVFLFNAVLLFIPYFFITTISTQFFTYLWVLPFSVLISLLLIYFVKDTYSVN